jgi:outer membrane protein assembly factor BamB
LPTFRIAFWALALLVGGSAAADWPTLHGDAQHTGFSAATLKPPFRLAWARHFTGERLGTAMEPIVGAGSVFVATHRGNLYALDAGAGQVRWRFQAHGPFLHSPTFAEDLVIAGSCDGQLYAVEAGAGRMRWSVPGGRGGFSASPVVAGGTVFIGSRQGEFLAVETRTGKARWRQAFGAPIRQTAAVAEGRVYVTAEDLRTRCLDASTGRLFWVSEPLIGQSARDYYPVIVKAGGRTYVIVRTNPVLNMAQHLAQEQRRARESAALGQRAASHRGGRAGTPRSAHVFLCWTPPVATRR